MVPERVSEEVEGEHAEEDAQRRHGDDLGRDPEVLTPGAEHRPQLGRGGLGAQSEEAQARRHQHVLRAEDGRLHHQRRHAGREDVAGQDPELGPSERPGRVHELAALHGEDHRPDEPDVVRRRPGGDGDHRVQEARSQDRHEDDREQEVGEGEQEVGGPHDGPLQHAPVEAGQEAQGHAGQHARRHGHDAHREGQAESVEQPAEEAAPDPVGAERVLLARRLQPEPEIGPRGIVRGEHVRAERAHQQRRQHHRSRGRPRPAEGAPAPPSGRVRLDHPRAPVGSAARRLTRAGSAGRSARS
jgi:hypothetical protein